MPLLILAGAEYGTGSSRDWAAKGPFLLGIRAAIASSFERIHRSNLVGMGILPLQLAVGQSWESLGLTGEEVFDVPDLTDTMKPGCQLTVRATAADGRITEFSTKVRIDTPVELEYYRNGGILQTVLRKVAKRSVSPLSLWESGRELCLPSPFERGAGGEGRAGMSASTLALRPTLALSQRETITSTSSMKSQSPSLQWGGFCVIAR